MMFQQRISSCPAPLRVVFRRPSWYKTGRWKEAVLYQRDVIPAYIWVLAAAFSISEFTARTGDWVREPSFPSVASPVRAVYGRDALCVEYRCLVIA
jgi:hypothetical protein